MIRFTAYSSQYGTTHLLSNRFGGDDVVEKLLTPKEVAYLLQVKPVTIMTYLRRGELKGVKVGRLWRVRNTDLEAFLQEGQGEKARA